ncbi:MAG TPA: STAS domain-containing protein [Burkholderiales bacterium]|nr:STAS domain-containing protein [Burkholderiales bacterium]
MIFASQHLRFGHNPTASVKKITDYMELDTALLDTVAAVAVKGRVDSTTADKLRDHLTQLIGSGSARLVLDLKEVSYISSAGFRTLLITARSVEHAKGKLALCGIGGEVKRLFDIASFTELFTILPNRDDAVAAARA